jgi:hypothetical protein
MSDTTTTQTSPGQTSKPPRKRHRVRNTLLTVAALGLIGGIASAASGGSHPATATPASSASSTPASPAKPAQPATASSYLTAHGYTVVEHWSNAKWQAENKNAAPYDPYIANGPDVVAAGSNGSKVQIVIKVADPAAPGLASVVKGLPAGTRLDGSYLVASMAMPASGDAGSAAVGTNPAPAASQPAAPATSAPAAPAGPTVSQQQALDSAQSYLSDGQGFSRAGLIKQLTSKYGEGFSQADATWAVDHSGANWDAQAVISAKSYMSDGQGFSRAGLIDQLTSPYGEQFTYPQAVYAAGQVGL